MGTILVAATDTTQETSLGVTIVFWVGVSIVALAILGLIGTIIYFELRERWDNNPRRVNAANAQEKFDALYNTYGAAAALRKALALGAVFRVEHIHKLVESGNTQLLEFLLRHDSSTINDMIPNGTTNALGVAVRGQWKHPVEVLQLYGAKPLPETVRWAIRQKSDYAYSLLRDSNILDSYGIPGNKPPLYDALHQHTPSERVVEYLLDKGAKIEPVQAELQRTFAKTGSVKARAALVRLQEIQNARQRLNGLEEVDTPNLWDHLDQASQS